MDLVVSTANVPRDIQAHVAKIKMVAEVNLVRMVVSALLHQTVATPASAALAMKGRIVNRVNRW